MIKKLIWIVCLAMSLPATAQQYLGSFPYNKKIEKDDNAGFLVEIAGNMSERSINGRDGVATAKGTVRLFPKIGVFYQRGFARRFSVRGSVSFGTSPFSYKYATVLDSVIHNTGVPSITSEYSNYTKRRQSGIFVQPQIDFGFITDPIFFKKISLELRAGIGAAIHLSRKDTTITYTGRVNDTKEKAFSNYKIEERTKQGDDEWGALLADVYLGVRWTGTFNDFLDRSALGVQLALPITIRNQGYTEIKYYSTDWNGQVGQERINMQLFTVGLRYTYRFFK